MHYAFDAWMAREYPDLRFERYCDGSGVVDQAGGDADQAVPQGGDHGLAFRMPQPSSLPSGVGVAVSWCK
jgi:hypothetical protein